MTEESTETGSPADPPSSVSYSIALDEVRRALDQQRADRDSLRNRAVALLGFATVAASVASGLSDPTATPGLWSYLAAGCVVVVVGVALAIARPRKFVFTQDVAIIIRWLDEHRPSDQQAHRQLALRMNGHYNKNAAVLDRMFLEFQLAIVALAAELALLTIDLWG